MNLARQVGKVNIFSCKADMQTDLEAALSPERMSTYLRAVRGNREKALRLYTWNTAISAAFYGPLQGLEVTLRNAMHRQLAGYYGSEWYDNPVVGLDTRCLGRIEVARRAVENTGHIVVPPRIVAALSFGFWVSLLGSGGRIVPAGRKADYEKTLWRPALRGAFPHCNPLIRKQVHSPLNDLRLLRNRIAHHEPIFARHLMEDHKRILDVTGWISPGTRAWIECYSRVVALLAPSNYATNFLF